MEHGDKHLSTSNEVFLLGVQQSLLLPLDSFVLGGLFLRRLLGLLDVGLLQEELSLALIQLILGGPQFLSGLAEPD